MKVTTLWRRNGKTSKKTPLTPKPKLAREKLGLKRREAAGTSLSIEEIRRLVIQASNRALGPGPESPLAVNGARSSDGGKRVGARPKAASSGHAARARLGISAQRAKS